MRFANSCALLANKYLEKFSHLPKARHLLDAFQTGRLTFQFPSPTFKHEDLKPSPLFPGNFVLGKQLVQQCELASSANSSEAQSAFRYLFGVHW